MKILVVDDLITMRHLMMNMLRHIGYVDLDEATDGIQALKMIRKNNYDLILTDFYMPKLNGKELLDKIRNDKELAHLPVIMVTCIDDKAEIEALIKSKVTGFIVKPFNTQTLNKQITLIRNKKLPSIPLDT